MSTVVTEIPTALKRLVRHVMRGFYTSHHDIVMDYLMRNLCMKEDDLVKLLKFERKQLRSAIAELKKDKFVQVRQRTETIAEGKTTTQNYYYINYKMFVNVLKYKLDQMRRKIETEERDLCNRASFKCTACPKTFTDLEANEIFNFVAEEWRCNFCGAPVEENMQKADSRLLLVRFNEQMTPLYDLLKEVDDIKLAPEILESEPIDMTEIKKNATDNSLLHSQGITINFGLDDSSGIKKLQDKKEQIAWMSESTIKFQSNDESESTWDKDKKNISVVDPTRATKVDDIMKALLAHETKSAETKLVVIPGVNNDEDSSSSAELLETFMESVSEMEEMESDEEDNLMVTVGDQKYGLRDVTEELVASMTPKEEETYIRLS